MKRSVIWVLASGALVALLLAAGLTSPRPVQAQAPDGRGIDGTTVVDANAVDAFVREVESRAPERIAIPVRVDGSELWYIAQAAIDALEPQHRPRIGDDGRLEFADATPPGVRPFARAVAEAVKREAAQRHAGHDGWDADLTLFTDEGLPYDLRVVIGADGGPGEAGSSIRGVTESRPDVLVLVAGGHGGPGLPAQRGGHGGSVSARVDGAAVIGVGGHGGDPGPRILGGDVFGGTGQNGADGGDVDVRGQKCKQSIVIAVAGDGSSAPPPAPLFNGGRGGRGGDAIALCTQVVESNPPLECFGAALGGQGGHGASGVNTGAPAGGNGGNGGRGGRAIASGCCGPGLLGEQPPLNPPGTVGDAWAVAGTGGHGGNGGNSLSTGGNGGNGGNGNRAIAVVVPGIFNSVARAVGGSGGNGGNGGNAIAAGGAAGNGGGFGRARANNFCEEGRTQRKNGANGVNGVPGN